MMMMQMGTREAVQLSKLSKNENASLCLDKCALEDVNLSDQLTLAADFLVLELKRMLKSRYVMLEH